MKQIAYHGSNTKISRFEIRSSTGNDQYGPGVYFTDSKEVAEAYGRFVHTVEIDLSKFVKPKTRLNVPKLKTMAAKASKAVLTDWAENPKEALRLLTDSLLNSDDMQDAMTYLWRDVFHLDNVKTCAEFVRSGYTGFVVPMKDAMFYTAFTPNVVRELEVS
jgi:hypothetical protein